MQARVAHEVAAIKYAIGGNKSMKPLIRTLGELAQKHALPTANPCPGVTPMACAARGEYIRDPA